MAPDARKKDPWKVSLHGGHSAAYCDHAESTLDEILDAAVACGYHTFGVAEHAPRNGEKYLYDEEIDRGWRVDTIQGLFGEYARALDKAVERYKGRLCVLKAFEAEVVPPDHYPEIMLAYKQDLNFDYMVGSVHYVGDIIIDYKPELFEHALEVHGGHENLAVSYYHTVTSMVTRLRPEVVGHFDIIRKAFSNDQDAHTPKIIAAACESLEAVRECHAILEVNTAGYRKGLGCPYPSPVYIRLARDMGIPVCFGDDSHAAHHVGTGIEAAREYLLTLGIVRITTLERGASGLNRKEVSLLE